MVGGICWFMVFNATFNNISVKSWRLVLLLEEIGVPEKTTDLLQVTDKLILSHNVVSPEWASNSQHW
jgi:hypothetical protein